MDYRRAGKLRSLNVWALTALGAVILIFYVDHTDNFLLFILLLLIVLLDLWLTWGWDRRRRRRAEKNAAVRGEYRLDIREDYIVYGEEKLKAGYTDAKTRLLCSEKVYVLKMKRDALILPKRIMNREQQGKLEDIMKRKHVPITEIQIERRE